MIKIIVFLSIHLFISITNGFNINPSADPSKNLKFYEEPEDTYLIKNIPKTLKCKIENARTGFFKCNNEWIQEDLISSKTIQVSV